MIVTESQARMLRCCGPEHVGRPMRQGDTAEDGPEGIYRYCIAHRCMAWRWEPVPDPPPPPTKPPAQPLGGCGLSSRIGGSGEVAQVAQVAAVAAVAEVAPVAAVAAVAAVAPTAAAPDDCLLELAVLAAGLMAAPET